MLDLTDLLVAVKTAAVQAVDASEPADACFGKVISTSPLKIQVEQKLTLGAAQLVLTRNVTDFETEVTVDWKTEKTEKDTGDVFSYEDHLHAIKGRKKIIIHNGLVVGDKVVLLQQKGGQKYIVLDRVVKV